MSYLIQLVARLRAVLVKPDLTTVIKTPDAIVIPDADAFTDWEVELLGMCEDYPCCGHTDGLGCNWVSPNEVVPCKVCIDARASYPYHNGYSCPTVEEARRTDVPDGAICDFCDEEEAVIMSEGKPSCYDCELDRADFNRSMQEQYDDYPSYRL